MVSKILASKITAKLPGLRRPFWKLGASSRRTLARILKNQFRNSSKKSDGTCPPKPDPPKCPLPDPTVCEAPQEVSKGRAAGQAEVFPCDPECRKGKPNLPPRGCLPWERGVELCPGKNASRKLETVTCQHLCEPYVGQEFIDKLQVSVCQYRRFKKCYEKTRDGQKCLDEVPKLGVSLKEYPMMHALQKKYLAGCPITSHHFVMPKKDTEC